MNSNDNSITREVAEQYLEDNTAVDLSKFSYIDDDAAELLGKSESALDLRGLSWSDLSTEARNSLFSHKGDLQLPFLWLLTSDETLGLTIIIALIGIAAGILGWPVLLGVVFYICLASAIGFAAYGVYQANETNSPVESSPAFWVGIVAVVMLVVGRWIIGWEALFYWALISGSIALVVIGIGCFQSEPPNQSRIQDEFFGYVFLICGAIFLVLTLYGVWLWAINVLHWVLLVVSVLAVAALLFWQNRLQNTGLVWLRRSCQTCTFSSAAIAVALTFSTYGLTYVGQQQNKGFGDTPIAANEKVLIIIVPGTFGNSAFWTNVKQGHLSFASEIRELLGANAEIYPFLWAGANEHRSRMMAAQNLSDVINERSNKFDRIFVVAHSHGGNVALRAADKCKSKIDMIVCLSTPHIHLETNHPTIGAMDIPVYCTPKSVNQVGKIVSIVPDSDSVVDGWAGWDTGLTDDEAIQLTRSWAELNQYPRLRDDSPDFLFQRHSSQNISVASKLNLNGAITVRYFSGITDGIKAHSCVHSRRMGRMVAELLRDGPTPARINYIRTFLQLSSSDTGEPIEKVASDPTTLNSLYAPMRLKYAKVDYTRDGKRLANDIDGSLPDLFLEGYYGKVAIGKTALRLNSNSGAWFNTRIVCAVEKKKEATVKIGVCDSEPFGVSKLHTFIMDLNKSDSFEFGSVPEKGWYWKAKFIWEKLHF